MRLLIILSFLAVICAVTGNYQRVCYVTNWTQYRPGDGKFWPLYSDPFLCTHLVYSFVEIGTNNELKVREWNAERLISEIMSVKQSNPDVLVTAAVGGWNFGTDRFTAVCYNRTSMEHFARTSVGFLREWGFDGLDLDWEYPGSRGSPAEDKPKFTELIEVLLQEYESEAQSTGQPRLLVTSAVSAGDATIEKGYEIAEICNLLDLVHLMTYDFHGGSWEDITGHNAPLRGHTGVPGLENFNVERAVDIWLDGGCPPEKLILGVASYGRTFKLEDPNNYGYNATAVGPGSAGTYTREAGFLAYYEICPLISQGLTVWDSDVAAPVLVVGDQWIAYDDKDSISTKVQYMKDRGLGGIMVWAVDNDDFNAICGEKNPILRTIYRELEGEDSPACFISPTTTAVTWNPPIPGATIRPPTTVICPYPTGPNEVLPSTWEPSTASSPAPPTTTTTTLVPTTCNDGNGLYPNSNPKKCNCYYQCLDGAREDSCCNPGEAFNPVTSQCEDALSLDCDLSFSCEGKPDGNYADEEDDTIFHQCAGGTDTVMQCAPGLVYDGTICNWP